MCIARIAPASLAINGAPWYGHSREIRRELIAIEGIVTNDMKDPTSDIEPIRQSTILLIACRPVDVSIVAVLLPPPPGGRRPSSALQAPGPNRATQAHLPIGSIDFVMVKA